jgi:hypothetical protein
MDIKEQAIELLKEYDGVAPCSHISTTLHIPMMDAIPLVREIQREQARQTWFEFIGKDINKMASYMVYYEENTGLFYCIFDRTMYATEFAAVQHTIEKLKELV